MHSPYVFNASECLPWCDFCFFYFASFDLSRILRCQALQETRTYAYEYRDAERPGFSNRSNDAGV